MKRFLLSFLWLLPLFLQAQLNYPQAKKEIVVDNYNGIKVEDPYRWMEDENSPDVKDWVEKENAVTQSYLSKIPFRSQWLQRLEQVVNYPRNTTPFRAN